MKAIPYLASGAVDGYAIVLLAKALIVTGA
jgi:hypothetical protein